MKYFMVLPEVAGCLGESSELDTSVHPPIVHKLHYSFQVKPQDAILRTFPSYIGTEAAAEALTAINATGVYFDEVELSLSDEFVEMYDDEKIEEKYRWFRVNGKPGKDDLGLTPIGRLIVSERALSVLRPLGLEDADVEEYLAGEGLEANP